MVRANSPQARVPCGVAGEACPERDSERRECGRLAERQGGATFREWLQIKIGSPEIPSVCLEPTEICIHCNFLSKGNAKANLYFIMVILAAMFAQFRYLLIHTV